MSVIRTIDSTDNDFIACKVAALQEVRDNVTGEWWLWYTMGADLAPKLDAYTKRGFTLSDPELTGLYSVGMPIHKRKIVRIGEGPSYDQALADADGENEFPRLAADLPVCYSRQVDGQTWLVYCKGPHLRTALDELWKAGKALSRLEVICTDQDENGRQYPLLYKGQRCYRRLILSKDNPNALNPADAS